jgi:colicin import membrane protein
MKETFRKLLVPLVLLTLGGGASWAQTTAADGNADLAAERARVKEERSAVARRAEQEQVACYQKFAVEDCLRESRRTRRALDDDLKRQEAAMNDIDRKRRAAAQLDRLDKAAPRPQDDPEKRQQSQQSQENREQRAVEHARTRAEAAAKSEANRRDFEAKQRSNAAEQAKAAQQRTEAPRERERYERKIEQAEEHRVSRERRNAARSKPRSAPLPAPP